MREGIINAYAGEVKSITHSDADMIRIEYSLYNGIEPVPNYSILNKMNAFGIQDEFEFHRNHWALKEADLFRTLLYLHPIRKGPKVFEIDQYPNIDRRSVSMMIPFDDKFNQVSYRSSESEGRSGRRYLGKRRHNTGYSEPDRSIIHRCL